jgi:DNA-binding NarL/FixJ family response regulator
MATYLESRGRLDVVSKTDQPKECLAAVREHNVQVILAEEAHLDEAQRQYLLGAHMLGSFGLLLITANDRANIDPAEAANTVSLKSSREEFFNRVKMAGEPYETVQTGRRGRRSDKPLGLSSREYEIAKLIAKGYSNRSISEETGIQEQSVKNSVSTILRKTGSENRTQLALKILG